MSNLGPENSSSQSLSNLPPDFAMGATASTIQPPESDYQRPRLSDLTPQPTVDNLSNLNFVGNRGVDTLRLIGLGALVEFHLRPPT